MKIWVEQNIRLSVPSQGETIITASLILVKIKNFYKMTAFSPNVILSLKRCRFFVSAQFGLKTTKQ